MRFRGVEQRMQKKHHNLKLVVSKIYENTQVPNYLKLGGGFKYFLFSPLLGEMIQFDEYFSKGLKPPTSKAIHSVLCE